jgi:hypothetical protein
MPGSGQIRSSTRDPKSVTLLLRRRGKKRKNMDFSISVMRLHFHVDWLLGNRCLCYKEYNDCLNWGGYRRKRLWPILEHYSKIWLKLTETKNLSQESWSAGTSSIRRIPNILQRREGEIITNACPRVLSKQKPLGMIIRWSLMFSLVQLLSVPRTFSRGRGVIPSLVEREGGSLSSLRQRGYYQSSWSVVRCMVRCVSTPGLRRQRFPLGE